MKNKKKGFTVVELVIVIAVIGILSAILIPTFVNLTKNAEDAARQENMRNAYVAYAAKAAEDEDDNINLYAEDKVVLSVNNPVDAESKLYAIGNDGKWEEAEYNSQKSYTDLGEYNGYHVYYVA